MRKPGGYYEEKLRDDPYYISRFPEENDLDFADPTGKSALRRATKKNPRNLPCPTCGKPNRLTPDDITCGYQCDACADRTERGGDY